MSPEPARLVLVVGPSGAGKDSLIRAAAAMLATEPRVKFVRRTVTRPADTSEDHESVDSVGFDVLQASGAFALHWQAHGLGYGIRRAELQPGTLAVANGSRAMLGEARRRFPGCGIVLVTAPRKILAARLLARGRESAIDGRLARDGFDAAWVPDLVIDNVGTVAEGAGRLAQFLRQRLAGDDASGS